LPVGIEVFLGALEAIQSFEVPAHIILHRAGDAVADEAVDHVVISFGNL